MFMRILLPLDGTSRAEEAIPLARKLASESGAQVYLLHVDTSPAPAATNSAIARRFQEIATELRRAGVEAHVLSVNGQTPTTIAAVAEIHDIDLIVMAPEARGAFGMLRRPSVTAGVLAKSPTPTLIAPIYTEGASFPMLDSSSDMVIVPLDGSALAEQALPLAVNLAERYHCGLLLTRVIPPIQAVMAGPGVYPLPADMAAAELTETQTYLHRMKQQIQQSSKIPVEWVALSGIPATELLAFIETKPGSVVVMSTHGRSGFARFMLGSVALELARKTSAPLFIVPATSGSTSKGGAATAQPEGQPVA